MVQCSHTLKINSKNTQFTSTSVNYYTSYVSIITDKYVEQLDMHQKSITVYKKTHQDYKISVFPKIFLGQS